MQQILHEKYFCSMRANMHGRYFTSTGLVHFPTFDETFL